MGALAVLNEMKDCSSDGGEELTFVLKEDKETVIEVHSALSADEDKGGASDKENSSPPPQETCSNTEEQCGCTKHEGKRWHRLGKAR